jgi:hypothetical protein
LTSRLQPGLTLTRTMNVQSSTIIFFLISAMLRCQRLECAYTNELHGWYASSTPSYAALCLRLLLLATWREIISFYFPPISLHSWWPALPRTSGMLILYTAQLLLLPTMTRTNFSYSKLPEESAPVANISLSCCERKREVRDVGWLCRELPLEQFAAVPPCR